MVRPVPGTCFQPDLVSWVHHGNLQKISMKPNHINLWSNHPFRGSPMTTEASIYLNIWVNYNHSLTWIVRPYIWAWFPYKKKNTHTIHGSRWSRGLSGGVGLGLQLLAALGHLSGELLTEMTRPEALVLSGGHPPAIWWWEDDMTLICIKCIQK